MTGVQQVSARVEELLDALKGGGFGPASSAAEELVGLLVGLYGDGLARVMTVLAEQGPAGQQMIAKLADDPLVESLLLLHDLHPLDVDARIQRALDRVRPYLGSHAGGVEYLGVFDGVARLRLEGSCHGCPSSTVTVQLAITGAVQDAAPEVSEVVVEGMTAAPAVEPKLLQIGRRPDEKPIQAGNGVGWITLYCVFGRSLITATVTPKVTQAARNARLVLGRAAMKRSSGCCLAVWGSILTRFHHRRGRSGERSFCRKT